MNTNAQILFRILAERRQLAHAYLLSGNDEEGKSQLVAKLLDNLNIHAADQAVLEPAQDEITISQIRELSAFLSMTSWSSPYKIGLLRQAHTMNEEAQSAFLKLLEEPKGDTTFFLLTEYPHILLDTILSRCQGFKFYNFQPTQLPAEIVREFEKLQQANLVERFAFAKKLADTPEHIIPKLEQWLQLLREQLPGSLQNTKTTQEIISILRSTNANPRLALERLMLDI